MANPPRHPDLTIVNLYSDEVKLWGAKASTWTISDDGVPIVCNPQMAQVDVIIDELRSEGRLGHHRLIQTDDLRVVSRLTSGGCGFGILPGTIARTEESDELQPIRNSPIVFDKICLIWRADSQRSKTSKVIRDAIGQLVRQK